MIALPDDVSGAVAVGWATVELDRAARELAHLLVPGSTFGPTTRSATLGARCRVGRGPRTAAGVSGPMIVLLEPDTEGRLARALARSGEGWVATWVASTDPGPDGRPGPFGAERLLRGHGASTRYRLAVDAVPSAS